MSAAITFSTFSGFMAIAIVSGFVLAFLFRFFTDLLTPRHDSMSLAIRPHSAPSSRERQAIPALAAARQKLRLRNQTTNGHFGDNHANLMDFSRPAYK